MSSDRIKNLQNRSQLLGEMVALTHAPLMRGSIVERVRRCGRKNCACARSVEHRHRGKFLSVQLDGRTQSLHLRPEDLERVQKAIAAYQRLWDIINGLTSCELSDLKRQARERTRARRKRNS